MIVSWILAVLLGLCSILLFMKAPALPLWFVAIAVIELSWVLAILSLLLAALWPESEHRALGRALMVFLSVLFLSPTVRAWRMGSDLPTQLNQAFSLAEPLPGPVFSVFSYLKRDRFEGVVKTTEQFLLRNGESLSMDVYRPAGDQPKPVILFVHGGSWRSGDRNELGDWNRMMAEWGYVVVAPDYRLVPRTVFPGQRDDIQDALREIEKNGKKWGADPKRVVLMGRSAGAQIAVLTAYTTVNPVIQGAISLYGPLDMEFAYSRAGNPLIMNSRQVLKDYMGGVPSDFKDGYQLASAVHQAGPATPPTLLIHGLNDALVWPNHAINLDARLNELGKPHYFLKIPWTTHASEAVRRGPSGQLISYACRWFLTYATR